MLQNDLFLFGFDFMPQLGTHLGIILLPTLCCFLLIWTGGNFLAVSAVQFHQAI
jgi:hypothetical protein